MKKSLLALAVAAALPAVAQAQSSVTLYGILDASVEWNSKGGANAASPSTAAGGFRLTDGAASWQGSRFGVRGVEPLGNTGMSGIFQIETRLGLDTGLTGGESVTAAATGFANTRFWNGLASVGLKGGFGELTVGRQYTPGFYAWLAADFTGNAGYNNWAVVGHGDAGTPTSTNAGLGQNQSNASYGLVRADNSVMLNSTLGALNVRAMVAMGEAATGTAANASGDLYALSGSFALGKQITVLGFYHKQDSFVSSTMDDAYGVAVKYDNGAFGASVGYSSLKRHDARDFDSIVLSAYLNVGSNKLFLNGSQVSSNTGRDQLNAGLTFAMPLSNRTTVYIAGSYVDQGDFAGRGTQTKAAVGLNHKF